MTDKTKKIGKYVSIALLVLSAAGCYLFGVTSEISVGVVAGVFVFGAIIVNALKS